MLTGLDVSEMESKAMETEQADLEKTVAELRRLEKTQPPPPWILDKNEPAASRAALAAAECHAVFPNLVSGISGWRASDGY